MTGQQVVNALKMDSLWTDSRDEANRLAGEYWDARMQEDKATADLIFKRMGEILPYRRTEHRDGSTLYGWTMLMTDRYVFDEGLCTDWRTLSTKQDASYYGVWINPITMETLSFCEGDVTLVVCKSREAYEEEVYKTVEFNRAG